MNPLLENNFITTKEAHDISGYSPDYLGRLARSKKVVAKRIGRAWLIERSSLEHFIQKQNTRKVEFSRELSRTRENEYHAEQSLIVKTARALTTPLLTPSVPVAASSFSLRREVFAVVAAFLVVGSGAFIAHAGSISELGAFGSTLALKSAEGFQAVSSALSATIRERVALVNRTESDAHLAAATRINRASASVAPIAFTVPSNTALALRTGASQIAINTVRVAELVHVSAPARVAVSVPTVQEILSAIEHAPLDATLALGNTIIAVTHASIGGEVSLAYGFANGAPIVAQGSVALIEESGAELALATAHLPSIATALYLGSAGAIANAAPTVANAAWSQEYALAQNFVAGTNTILALDWGALAGTSDIAGTIAVTTTQIGAKIAAVAPQFSAIAEDRVLGALGKTALALDQLTPTIIRTPLNRLAVAAVAAALPPLSAGEQAALSTYMTINSLFKSASDELALILSPEPNIILPSPVAITHPAPITATSSAVRTIATRATYNTIVQGVSQNYVDQSIADAKNNLIAQMNALVAPLSRQVVTNETTIQQVNMIQSLTDLILHTPVIDGAQISNSNFGGHTVSADLGTFGSLIAIAANLGSTTVNTLNVMGDTTLAGNLTIGGNTTLGSTTIASSSIASLTATNATITNATTTNLIAQNFSITGTGANILLSTDSLGHVTGTTTPSVAALFATSTTATSTFAGGLAVGNNFLNILQNGRIGIGTSTPAVAFDIYATDAMRLPVGTSLDCPAVGDVGYVRYNTTTHQFEGFGDNQVWQGLGGVINAAQTTYITADDANILHFVTNSTERMSILANGNVGIGSTTPFSRLSLAGLAGDSTNLFTISTSTSNSTTTALTVDNNGNLSLLNGTTLTAPTINAGTALQLNGTNINTAGTLSNVAYLNQAQTFSQLQQFAGGASSTALALNYTFGGTAPLTIMQNGISTPVFTIDHSGLLTASPSTATSGGALFNFGNGSGQVFSGGTAFLLNPATVDGTSYLLAAQIGGNTKFVIDHSGSVGIGNNNPGKTLDVTGTTRISGVLTLSGLGSPCVGAQALQADSLGNISCGSISTTGISSAGGWTTNNVGLVTLSTSTDAVALGATSTPYAKFVVIGSKTASTTLAIIPFAGQTANILDLYNNSGNLFSVITGNGNIGIGTSTPASSVDIYATDALHLPVGTSAQRPAMALAGQVRYNTTTHQFEGFGDNSVWQGLGGVINAAQTSYITADASDFLHFVTASIERMTIASNGNVGIGSTSPYAALSVSTSTSYYAGQTLFAIANSASSTLLSVLGNGNVGIGTTTPGTLLGVQGTGVFAGNLYATNIVATSSITAPSLTLASALTVPNGGTGQVSFPSGNLIYGAGTGALQSAATTTLTTGGALSFSANPVIIGASSPSLSLSNNSTLTTSGNTLGINLANPNIYTALQTFANASSTLFSSTYASSTNAFFGTLSVGGSATISSLSVGNLNGLLSGTNGAVSATANGTNGQVLAMSGGIPTWVASTTLANISGTLGVASGGTGSAVTFTQGSAIFAGAGGIYSQDNANYFYDAINHRLGLGTTSPYAQLSVFAGGDYLSHAFSTLFAIGSSTAGTATTTLFSVDSAGNVNEGTAAATTTIAGGLFVTGTADVENSILGSLTFANDAGAGLSWMNLPLLSAAAATPESYSASIAGTPILTVYGTSNGSGGVASYGVGIGTTVPLSKLDVNGGVAIGAYAGANAAPSNGMIISGNVGIGTTSPYANLSVMAGGDYANHAPSTVFAIGSSTAGTATTTLFSVNSNGNVNALGYLRVGSTATPANTTAGDLTATRLSIGNSSLSNAATDFGLVTGTMSATSGGDIGFYINPTIAPVSDSSAEFRAFNMNATINAAGINFTGSNLTSPEALRNEVRVTNSGNITEVHGATMYGLVLGSAAATMGTVTAVTGIYVRAVDSFSNALTSTISNAYGIRISNNSNSGTGPLTYTNQAGLTVEAQTTATNNTGILLGTATIPTGNFGIYNSSTNNNYFAGNLGVGVTSPSYKLDVAGFINTDQYSGYKQAGNTVLYASTTNASLAVGASSAAAWMAASSTLLYNIAIGSGALNTAPTSAGTAQFNTAIGANSLLRQHHGK